MTKQADVVIIGAGSTGLSAAYELAKVQYEVGKVDFLNVLELQNRWIGSQMSLLNVRQQQLAERINLHLALGGSFEKGHSPAGTDTPSQSS